MTKTPNSEPKHGEWLGYFYGHDLTFLHAELLAIQNVKDALLKKESALMKVKWFDYRRMHPTKATYFLAHSYNKAYSRFISITQDGRSAPYMRGFKGMDFMLTKERLSFWRLRQHIDKLGIRYDFYLMKGMDWCIANGWLQPARPSHLMTNEEMVTDIMMAWEEECAIRMQFALDDRYKVSNFFGHSDQLAYEQFIIDSIKTRQRPHFALNAALYLEDAVRIEKALEEFSERVVEEAINFSGVK